MIKKIIPAIGFCLILLVGNAFAQKNAVKFSSQYSNLDKDCKTLKGGDGTDDASDCRGVGGYRIYVGAAAAMQFINAETPDKKDRIQLATQNFDFSQTKIKVEWRIADGKPFSVIMRVFSYSEDIADGEYFGKKTGEKLIVKGLRGFDYIDFEVDAKSANANQKARELADKAYSEKNAK
jgi:hypothetical protein